MERIIPSSTPLRLLLVGATLVVALSASWLLPYPLTPYTTEGGSTSYRRPMSFRAERGISSPSLQPKKTDDRDAASEARRRGCTGKGRGAAAVASIPLAPLRSAKGGIILPILLIPVQTTTTRRAFLVPPRHFFISMTHSQNCGLVKRVAGNHESNRHPTRIEPAHYG